MLDEGGVASRRPPEEADSRRRGVKRDKVVVLGVACPVGNDTDRLKNPWDVTRPEIRPFDDRPMARTGQTRHLLLHPVAQIAILPLKCK